MLRDMPPLFNHAISYLPVFLHDIFNTRIGTPLAKVNLGLSEALFRRGCLRSLQWGCREPDRHPITPLQGGFYDKPWI
jgi:hypothetical protein